MASQSPPFALYLSSILASNFDSIRAFSFVVECRKNNKMKWSNLKPFKKLLVSGGGSTGGRNSAGRITIYHRGGGAKRLHRKIDLKRSTSSMGVVERIEYDPNRSSRVALVRWIEGVQPGNRRECEKGFSPPPSKIAEPTTNAVLGQFPLACLAPGLMMGSGLVGNKEDGSKLSSVRAVFVSAFSSQKPKEESLHNFPRFAVAGSKPAVFAPQERKAAPEGEKTYSPSDVQSWKKDSVLWEHRLKRKAALSWTSFVREEPVGLAVAADSNEMKQVGKSSKKVVNEDRVPLTYIIASNELEPGKMVINCDWSKVPARKF